MDRIGLSLHIYSNPGGKTITGPNQPGLINFEEGLAPATQGGGLGRRPLQMRGRSENHLRASPVVHDPAETGGTMGAQTRDLPDGSKIRIVVRD